jgi:hypothetical protein
MFINEFLSYRFNCSKSRLPDLVVAATPYDLNRKYANAVYSDTVQRRSR